MLRRRKPNKEGKSLESAWKKFQAKVKELNKKGKGIPGVIIDAVLSAYFPGYPIVRKLVQGLLDDPDVDPEIKDELLPLLQEILALEGEISDRHRIDMLSDSWLSKNVRPMILIFLVLFTATISVLNSIWAPNDLVKLVETTKLDLGKVDVDMIKGADHYFFYMREEALGQWLKWTGLGIGFYFGLRDVVKGIVAFKSRPEQ